jgi:hypothetical protein
MALTLGLTRPRLGPLVVCIVALGAPLGFAATLSAAGWWRLWRDYVEPTGNWGRADWISLVSSTVVVVFSVLILRVMLWRSGVFLTRRRWIQWLHSLLWLIAGIALIVALVFTFDRAYGSESYRY